MRAVSSVALSCIKSWLSLTEKLSPASVLHEKRASRKPHELKSSSGFFVFPLFIYFLANLSLGEADFRDDDGTALHDICVVAFADRRFEVECHHNCCEFRLGAPICGYSARVGGCFFPPPRSPFFLSFFYTHPSLDLRRSSSAPPPLSPRHSVGRRSKVTTRRPFLALGRSLKGNNGGMRDGKNGRISRKTGDKVAQNAGLAELCRGGGVIG